MTRSEGRAARATAWLCALLLLTLTAPSRAAEGDEAGARSLFGEGRKLADAGHYSEACSKFEESLRLDPGVGTSFNLADCQEHLGRTASAWTRFLEVAAATRRDGQVTRARVAQARADALEPRLARMVLAVSSPAPGLVVERDGLVVDAAGWETPVPVDPGPHVVEARAPGRRTWSQRTTVPDAPATLVIAVPALEVSTVALPPATVSSRATPPSPVRLPIGEPARRWSRPTVALGALGVAGLAAGAFFAVRFQSENDQAKALCVVGPNNLCLTPTEMMQHQTFVDDARRDSVLAYVGAGIGTAALLSAAYLWWRSRRGPSPTPTARLSMSPAIGQPGAVLVVVW
jgi:hypothetical protein